MGSGPGISVSDVELDGTESEASALGATYMASVSYLAPFAENLRLGIELKYYHINKSNDNNIVLQVTFGWKFLEW